MLELLWLLGYEFSHKHYRNFLQYFWFYSIYNIKVFSLDVHILISINIILYKFTFWRYVFNFSSLYVFTEHYSSTCQNLIISCGYFHS